MQGRADTLPIMASAGCHLLQAAVARRVSRPSKPQPKQCFSFSLFGQAKLYVFLTLTPPTPTPGNTHPSSDRLCDHCRSGPEAQQPAGGTPAVLPGGGGAQGRGEATTPALPREGVRSPCWTLRRGNPLPRCWSVTRLAFDRGGGGCRLCFRLWVGPSVKRGELVRSLLYLSRTGGNLDCLPSNPA